MTDTRSKPNRVLRPDETFCSWCGEYFLDGDIFEAHRPKGWCVPPHTLGWVRDGKGAWGYKGKGSAPTTSKPRRTPAQASFDRLLKALVDSRPPTKRAAFGKEIEADVRKVLKALERERDLTR